MASERVVARMSLKDVRIGQTGSAGGAAVNFKFRDSKTGAMIGELEVSRARLWWRSRKGQRWIRVRAKRLPELFALAVEQKIDG